jgi:hypothetical protein
VRLGTASLASSGGAGGPFIKPDRLDMRKYAARPNLARVLCDYIIYVVRSWLQRSLAAVLLQVVCLGLQRSG